MGIYIDLLMVALITIYIVDISGFTQSWRDALARWLKVSTLKPLKLSHLSNPIGEALIFIRECLTWLLNRIMP